LSFSTETPGSNRTNWTKYFYSPSDMDTSSSIKPTLNGTPVCLSLMVYGFSDTCHLLEILVRHCVPSVVAPAPAVHGALAVENASTRTVTSITSKLSSLTTILLYFTGGLRPKPLMRRRLEDRNLFCARARQLMSSVQPFVGRPAFGRLQKAYNP